MNLNINFSQFEQLYKQGITLDMLFLLQEMNIDEVIVTHFYDNDKINILFQTLIRKGLCTSIGGITLSGKELLSSIKEEKDIPIKKKKVVEDSFERFWSSFPSTDFFTHKGKSFKGDRSLRMKKEDCKTKLKAILNEGEYTIDEIIKALEFEILQKKEKSIMSNTNKLSFMQNSFTYLHQRSYQGFAELIKEGINIKETNLQLTGTDI